MKSKTLHCEVENLLNLIAGRWKVLLLRELVDGPCRHGQLLRALGGITQKILTQKLRELEAAGLVHRRGFMEGRVKVAEYSLTGWGEEVMGIVAKMHKWAVVNRGRLIGGPNLNDSPRGPTHEQSGNDFRARKPEQ